MNTEVVNDWESWEHLLIEDLQNGNTERFEYRLKCFYTSSASFGVSKVEREAFVKEKLKEPMKARKNKMIDNECGMAVMPMERDSCRLPNDRTKMLYPVKTYYLSEEELQHYRDMPLKPDEKAFYKNYATKYLKARDNRRAHEKRKGEGK